MALVPAEPSDQHRLLAILVTAAIGGLYWMHVHVPRSSALEETGRRLARLEGENRAARARAVAPGDVRAKLETYERRLDAVEGTHPGPSEVARLLEAVGRAGRTRGVSLVEVSPAPGGDDRAAEGRLRRWEMTVEGPYHGVGGLLAEMGSLGRFVRPSVRALRPAGDPAARPAPGGADGVPLSVTLDLEVHLLAPDSTEASATADAERRPPATAGYRYGGGGRRDPFRPPTPAAAGDEAPALEGIRLAGVLYAPGGGSVAVLVEATSGRRHRLRVGDHVRTARVAEIHRDRIVFAVRRPGADRRTVLRLGRADGSPR